MNKLPVSVSLPAHHHAAPAINMAEFRAQRFEKALKEYVQTKGNLWVLNSAQYWLADMLADAFHWCDVNGSDPEFVLKLTRSHHEGEKLADTIRSMQTFAQNSASPPH